MSLLWLLLGLAAGLLSGLTIRWSVSRMRPGTSLWAVISIVGGAFLRWTLAAGFLALALQRGIGPGLFLFAGLWLARWGTVYLTLRVPLESPRS